MAERHWDALLHECTCIWASQVSWGPEAALGAKPVCHSQLSALACSSGAGELSQVVWLGARWGCRAGETRATLPGLAPSASRLYFPLFPSSPHFRLFFPLHRTFHRSFWMCRWRFLDLKKTFTVEFFYTKLLHKILFGLLKFDLYKVFRNTFPVYDIVLYSEKTNAILSSNTDHS